MYGYMLLKISTQGLSRNIRTEKTNLGESLILVEILRILLWRQTGWNDAWLEEDLICGKNVSEVCQPRDSKMNLTVVKVSKKLVGILFALVKDTFWGLLSAIVCNLRTFVGHFISSIWLKFGMKSCFRVLITEWISNTSSYFCMAKKRVSALGLPIHAHQYSASKVIF